MEFFRNIFGSLVHGLGMGFGFGVGNRAAAEVMDRLSKSKTDENLTTIPPVQETPHFCPNCRTANPASDKFCGSCGKEL